MTPKKLKGSTLTFDDVVTDDNGHQWTQLCDEHADHLEKEDCEGCIDMGGSGICGAVGCDKESNHYYDF